MINQFSAHYDDVEDRILLRFNTKDMQEFRLWLVNSTLITITSRVSVAAIMRRVFENSPLISSHREIMTNQNLIICPQTDINPSS